MKIFVKIALIAAIAALAVLSCEPGIPDPHNEWWDEYNEQFDGSTYIDDTESNPAFGIKHNILTGDDRVNTVTITLPRTADALKYADPETKLKEFLSFWTFNPNSAVDIGEVTVLDELKDWILYKRFDNQLIIDLKTVFTPPCSGVVVKIDGTKYTYYNGKKMDRDGNGITGEKIYDDFYSDQLTFTGSIGAFVKTENKGWTITLASLPSGVGTDDTSIEADLPLASFADNLTLQITQADREAILRTVTGGFKVEKFSDGEWSNHAVAVYDEKKKQIIAKDNTFSHMTGYRIVFNKGDISLETKKEFFGVKQRIKITDGVRTIYNIRKNVTRLESGAELYYNENKRKFYSDFYSAYNPARTKLEVSTKDGLNKNVVLRLEITVYETITNSDVSEKYFLKTLDLAEFTDNFKIFESNINAATITQTDRREVGITAVEFTRENQADDTKGANVIYITLDPNYQTNDVYANRKYKTFLIGAGLCYESGIGVFSDKNIWINNGFKAHDLRRAF